MFFNLLIIAVCVPLHVYWLMQVVRLLRDSRNNSPRSRTPLPWMLSFAAQR
jgi:hypothetical protein